MAAPPGPGITLGRIGAAVPVGDIPRALGFYQGILGMSVTLPGRRVQESRRCRSCWAADFDPGALVAGDQFFGFLRAGLIDPFACADVNQWHVLRVDERDTPETSAAAVRERRAGGSLVWQR